MVKRVWTVKKVPAKGLEIDRREKIVGFDGDTVTIVRRIEKPAPFPKAKGKGPLEIRSTVTIEDLVVDKEKPLSKWQAILFIANKRLLLLTNERPKPDEDEEEKDEDED